MSRPAGPTSTGMLTLDRRGAWLRGVRRVPTPNCDPRPPGCEIELIVVHGISLPPGCFGGPHIERLFCNRLDPADHADFAALCDLRVSAHALIRRDGELVQFCRFDRRAWHAGASSFEGRERCNDFSVGIELEGTDRLAYEPVQYRRLAELCAVLMERYPGITPARVVGHCDIAPGRKTDPGPAFDWERLRRGIERACGGAALSSRARSPAAT